MTAKRTRARKSVSVSRRSAQTRVSVIEKEYGVDLGVRFVEMVEQLAASVFIPNYLRNLNVDVAINKAKKIRFGNQVLSLYSPFL